MFNLKKTKYKIILIFLGIFLLSFFFFKPSFSANDPLSVITKAHENSQWQSFTTKKLLKGNKVSAKFKAEMNNLGIVAVRFNTFGRINDGGIVFKLKEEGAKEWHYQNTYKVDQFQNGELFPFGFPPLANSEGKNYVFTLESTSTDPANAIALNQVEPTFVSRYQFSKAAFLSNKSDIFKLFFKKVNSVVDLTQLGTQILMSAFLTIFILLLYSSKFEQFLNKNPRLINIFIGVIAVSIAFYLVGENLRAQFGPVDDHLIMHFLGSDQKVRLFEIPKLILSTEVGQFGSYQRFRPTYSTLLVLESFLWGNNPFLWYFTRLAMTSAEIAILLYLVVPFLGVIVGLLFTLFILTYPFWSDIWTRLGPGEIYAVFGTVLYMFGFASLLKKFKNNKSGILLLFIGFVLAAGSKENFLILLFPTIYLAVKHWKLINKEKFNFVFLVLQIVYGLFVASAIVIAILRSGHDVYLNQVTPTNRLQLFAAGATSFIDRLRILYLGIFAAVVGIFIFIKKSPAQFRKYLRLLVVYFGGFILLGLIFISQYVFYGGAWLANMRYDFPGILVVPFGWILVSMFIFQSMKVFHPRLSKKHLLLFLTIVLFFLIWSRGYGPIRDASAHNSQVTNGFKQRVDKIVQTARDNPNKPLVFESYNLWDYESIFALHRYLTVYNIQRPMYLRLHGYPKNIKVGTLENQLITELTTYSRKGGSGGFAFRPLKQLTSKNCISIVFFSRKRDEALCQLARDL